MKLIVTALMPSLLFCCFPLFLPHLTTLAQEKIVFVLGLVAESLFVSINVAKYNKFPALTMVASEKKKDSVEAICSHYQRALSGF